MKISSDTMTLRKRFGNEQAIHILADAGFTCIDITLDDLVEESSSWNKADYLQQAAHLRSVADQRGVRFNQAHAPFMFNWADFDSGWRDAVDLVIRSFDIAKILGVDTVIVHPIHHFVYADNQEKVWDLNLRYFRTLLPHAKKRHIRMTLENMFQFDQSGCPTEDALSSGEKYIKAMEVLNDTNIVACVDVGHVAMLGRNPGELIRQLGHDRVKALHIHDNDAVWDRHTLPYLGKIDWDDVCRALAEIDYDGVFTFETMMFLAAFEDDFIPTAVRWLYEMGKYLTNKVENYKTASKA